MPQRWLDESRLALQAAAAGAEMLEQEYRGVLLHVKGNFRDIATEVDVAIEKQLRAMLGGSKYPVNGEEIKKGPAISFPIKGGRWFVDPIDGTVNFISHIPWYGVSVGLVHDGKFVAGAVAVPARKELFFTMGDSGSFLNDRALKAGSAQLSESLVAASFSGKIYNPAGRTREYELYGALNDASRGCLRTGAAAVNICYCAAGRFQAAYGIANKIWDVAGALAVAARAGCAIYVEWIRGTDRMSYVAGAGHVAEEIAGRLIDAGLADMHPLRPLSADNATARRRA